MADDPDFESLIAQSVDRAVAARMAAVDATSRAMSERLALVEAASAARTDDDNDDYYDALSVSASAAEIAMAGPSADLTATEMMDMNMDSLVGGRSAVRAEEGLLVGGRSIRKVGVAANSNSYDITHSDNFGPDVMRPSDISAGDSTTADRKAVRKNEAMEFEYVGNSSDGSDHKLDLPESTFTFMITEKLFSAPFVFALCATAISMVCLGLALAESIAFSLRMGLRVPIGVSPAVTAAQFVGIILGVLFEAEVPEGLQLIAYGMMDSEEVRRVRRGRRSSFILVGGDMISPRRVVLSSLLRIAVGYMFLAALFVTVVQAESVIAIFYDVLALGFVESIDDHAYAMAKRGFFGKTMVLATHEKKKLLIDFNRKRGISSRYWSHRCARIVYFSNAVIMLAGLSVITVNQQHGKYRCGSITVNFEEEIWERAHVVIDMQDGFSTEERLLLYSHFSGTYIENGTHGGYPRYTEQNKRNSSKFEALVGAELLFCHELEAWVFRHELIKTSQNGKEENECSWLMRSPDTITFDIEEAADYDWNVWTGVIKPSSGLYVSCNECANSEDCGHRGTCSSDRQCKCDDEGHFGYKCEHERPCDSLVSEKQGCCGWRHENPILLVNDNSFASDNDKFNTVYNRPIYFQTNLTGIPYDMRKFDKVPPDHWSFERDSPTYDFANWDDFFDRSSEHDGLDDLLTEGYSVIIYFTGNRWCATMLPLSETITSWLVRLDYHAFWNTALDPDRTFIMSDITSTSYPTGVDWFEMRRRINYKLEENVSFYYGPIGVLVPLVGYEGSGWFHCPRVEPTGLQ
eukprot:CAMPEP_0181093132 /NCGR_PEP_ID=MMETSP1071-20121207/9285_1 /TAXON_ID=35127 /ORGANISM="Thalassiosira sp., Strain NH16" /LENGTH=802 /DNA_ID=CAMNT_0023175351 /DNA_START=14 /DNA_END=2422 /DNA_ORIENTATION=+